MYRSVIWFKCKPGLEQEFQTAFLAAGMLTRPSVIDGFNGAQLFQSTLDSTEFHVFAEWNSPEDYAHWQSIASNDAPQDALRDMMATLQDSRPGVLFAPVA